jgi:hypothetical protein
MMRLMRDLPHIPVPVRATPSALIPLPGRGTDIGTLGGVRLGQVDR